MKARQELENQQNPPSHHAKFATNSRQVRLVECVTAAVNMKDCFIKCDRVLASELGLLTLAALSPHSNRRSFGEEKPLTKFVCCPFVTIHDSRGNSAFDGYWYFPFPKNSMPDLVKSGDIEKLRVAVDRYRKKLDGLPWRERAISSLERYQRACSAASMEESFLEGWRTLEYIAGDGMTNGQTLIKRAAGLWEQASLAKEYGNFLQFRRNHTAHHGNFTLQDNEVLAFKMQNLVRSVLLKAVTNPYRFKTYSEFIDFLDNVYDQRNIDQKVRVLNAAKSFCS